MLFGSLWAFTHDWKTGGLGHPLLYTQFAGLRCPVSLLAPCACPLPPLRRSLGWASPSSAPLQGGGCTPTRFSHPYLPPVRTPSALPAVLWEGRPLLLRNIKGDVPHTRFSHPYLPHVRTLSRRSFGRAPPSSALHQRGCSPHPLLPSVPAPFVHAIFEGLWRGGLYTTPVSHIPTCPPYVLSPAGLWDGRRLLLRGVGQAGHGLLRGAAQRLQLPDRRLRKCVPRVPPEWGREWVGRGVPPTHLEGSSSEFT